MHRKDEGIIEYLLMLGVVIAIGYIGYTMYQNGQVQKPDQSEGEVQPTATMHDAERSTDENNNTNLEIPTTQVKETSNKNNPITEWKTYTNKQFGVSFKYPPYYYSINAEKISKTEIVISIHLDQSPLATSISLTKNTDDFLNHQDLNPCSDYNHNEYPPGGFPDCLVDPQNRSNRQEDIIADYTLDGSSAISFYVSCGVDCEHHYIQTTEGSLVQVKAFTRGYAKPDHLNQILSTFEFTN